MSEFDNLVQIMERLRGENGCEWDKKQTIETLKEYLLEETYETLEVMSQGGDKLKGELGDLLLNIVFQAQISKEKNEFNMEDVVRNLNEKLIRRHPHIFSEEVKNLSSEEVRTQWEAIKKKEKEHLDRVSILDGIPKTLPPLLKAEKIIRKVSKVGFDWDNVEGVLEKVEEEITELKVEIKNKNYEKTKEEIGDLIFSLVNLGRFLDINTSEALEDTNNKFQSRFRYIEKELDIENSTLSQMEEKWKEAKEIERRKK